MALCHRGAPAQANQQGQADIKDERKKQDWDNFERQGTLTFLWQQQGEGGE